MGRPDDYISDDHRAELEDRADDVVERDWRYGQEWRDNAEARAQQEAHDRAVFAERAARDARLGLDRPRRDRIYDR